MGSIRSGALRSSTAVAVLTVLGVSVSSAQHPQV